MCKLTIPPQHPAVNAFNLGSAAAQPGRRQRLLLGFRPEGGWPGSKGPGGRRSGTGQPVQQERPLAGPLAAITRRCERP